MTRKQYAGALGVLAVMGLLGGIVGASVVDALRQPGRQAGRDDPLVFDDEGLLCVRGIRIETPDGKKRTLLRPALLALDTLSGFDASEVGLSEGHIMLTTGEGTASLRMDAEEAINTPKEARCEINLQALGGWPKLGMTKGHKETVLLHHPGMLAELTLRRDDGTRLLWSPDVTTLLMRTGSMKLDGWER